MPRIPKLRSALGAALLSLALPALAGPIGYSAWDVTGTDKLVRFDMATGVGTVLGAIQTAGGVGFHDVDGMAFDSQGQLWGVNDDNNDNVNDNSLIRIDTATGQATLVGAMGSGLNDMGLAFGGSVLYMAATDTAGVVGSLYTVDSSTGAVTLVGGFGLDSLGRQLRVRSLGYFNNTLYGWSNRDTLLSIDTSTGAATTIGAFGFAAGGRDGMDVDPNTGMIWGLGDFEARTYTLNASTGLATVVAQQVCMENNVANVGCSGGGFNALAIQAVPEPASFGLAGLALLGLAGQRRRRIPR